MEATQATLHIPAKYFVTNDSTTYHYYDCDCTACHDMHYPCQDEACNYCTSIRDIEYRMNNSYWNPQVLDRTMLLPFSIYESWDADREFDPDELIMTRCDFYGCNALISKYDADRNSSYCEHHSWAGQDDEDEYTDEDEDDDRYRNDGRFTRWNHSMGEVLDSSEYHHTTEAWIAPNGDLHFVPCYNDYGVGHYETANKLGFNDTSDAERNGYIHVSTYYSSRYPFHYVPNNYTDDQVYTTQAFCDAHGWDYPEFVNEWMAANAVSDEYVAHDIVITPMQNLSPSWLSMTRKERDMWYPLSGD